ncbi:hypothetical protein L798_12493 [Zootermopsis nevadensis]|uniref:Uncharacterized protein n=1 Tax=Zootermopsis nevadensis TaxID=136037 RepID=A0A067QTQ3_ZOONE|nr:hypothetical protein L798_12493 [Zootermopsis nevadensis]
MFLNEVGLEIFVDEEGEMLSLQYRDHLRYESILRSPVFICKTGRRDLQLNPT